MNDHRLAWLVCGLLVLSLSGFLGVALVLSAAPAADLGSVPRRGVFSGAAGRVEVGADRPAADAGADVREVPAAPSLNEDDDRGARGAASDERAGAAPERAGTPSGAATVQEPPTVGGERAPSVKKPHPQKDEPKKAPKQTKPKKAKPKKNQNAEPKPKGPKGKPKHAGHPRK